MRKILFLFTILGTMTIMAQGVTTSNIEGSVRDESGAALPSATVYATHVPTGSNYGVSTNDKGQFNLDGLRSGGPYKVVISYIGFQDQTFDGIIIGLGKGHTINAVLKESGLELEGITISSKRGIADPSKTGASTNLGRERINAVPTISRSLNDFTRLTPQSNGTAFAGTNNRFNNYTIDGNIYNNNFGLGSGQFAGSNPISLDAIEEVQVNLAPFDVRLSGFTGASVNAITKSGTNEFKGTLYYLMRNDQMIGDKLGDTKLNVEKSETEIKGLSLGGPIIKDKLFFFVNYENEEEFVPSFQKRALRPGETPNQNTISRVPVERLEFVKERMKTLYGYDTGAYEGYNFESKQQRFNTRLDWNINNKHKVLLRHNYYTGFNDVPVNGNSIRYIQTRYTNTNRFGIEAMNFRNSNYTNDRKVSSFVAEWNAIFSDKLSSQLNLGYTSVIDPKRGIPGGQDFPFIEVLEPGSAGNLEYYMTMGNELFTVGNLLENDIFNATYNLTYYLSNHKITAGANYENFKFLNAFNPVFHGFYRFTSYDSFERAIINREPGVLPAAFAKGYALDGTNNLPVDETTFNQFGVYIQDQWKVLDNLRLTFGLRVDMPSYSSPIPRNTLLDQLIVDRGNADPSGRWSGFRDINGNFFIPDVSQFPKVTPLWSPRFGFNWDVKGDGKTQVRGGTGIFTGRIPFVWLSNQVNGSGVVRGGVGYEGAAVGAAFGNNWQFDPSVTFGNPTNPSQSLSNELNLTDRNFKLPQVWRSNLGVDQQLPWGITATVDLIYSQDVSTPIAYNSVLRDADRKFSGADDRPFWSSTNYSNDPAFRNVFLLTNANTKADYYSATLNLSKNFDNGFSTFAAYTRSRSRDLDAAGGFQAVSLWSQTVKENRNNPELSFAGHDIPNRVISGLTYQKKGTTLSLLYEGSDGGRFSYTYSGNFGDSSNRLMYIPNNANEITFEPFTVGGVLYTQDAQRQLLDNYINQDKYLSANRGKVADRNGALLPWVNRFDFRMTQDIVLSKKEKSKLQLSLDILNIGNMLNSDWGVRQFPNQRTLMNYRGATETIVNGVPTYTPRYRLNTLPGSTEFPTQTFRNSNNISDSWRMQVGVRYLFN